MDQSSNMIAEAMSDTSASSPIAESRLTGGQRRISCAEFLLGAAIVIGHNVSHVIPNEVPILFVLGLISLRVRNGGWGVLGLRLPLSWRNTVLLALAAAAARILLGSTKLPAII